MNRPQILGFIRHALTAAGGGLATSGTLSQDELQQGIGALITLIGIIWSVVEKRRASGAPPSPPSGPANLAPLILLLGALALAILPLAVVTGCATSSGPVTPDRVQRISRLAVWTTTVSLISTQPDREPAFRKARQAVDRLAQDEIWDVGALSAALVATGEETFTGPDGRMIMAGTALLIETMAGDRVNLRDPPFIRAVILGARDGLSLALGI